jgi:hypothetical protein
MTSGRMQGTEIQKWRKRQRMKSRDWKEMNDEWENADWRKVKTENKLWMT